jgi:O-antigen ligase
LICLVTLPANKSLLEIRAPLETFEQKSHQFWPICYTAFLAAMILTGGISLPSSQVIYFHSIISLLILSWALARLLSKGLPSHAAVFGAALALGALALVLMQLIPLPFSLWSNLPIRWIVIANDSALKLQPGNFPLSLTPENTRLTALALLPAIAAFFGALSLKTYEVTKCFFAIVACALLSAIFAFLQFFFGQSSALYFYEYSSNIGLGTFNNPNFFSAQIYTAIPLIAAITISFRQKNKFGEVAVSFFSISLTVVLLAGLALSGSRAGILLAMVAIFGSMVLVYKGLAAINFRNSAATISIMIFGFFIIGQSSMVGLLRLASDNNLAGGRVEILGNSIKILRETFPLGSGFGSFVPLYQMLETPQTVQPAIMNHVHNDWLELAIEGGAVAIFMEGCFLVLLCLLVVRIWFFTQSERNVLFQRSASLIVILLGIHSLVDFALRTPALLTLFAFAAGLLTIPPQELPHITRKRKRQRAEPIQTEFTRPKVSFSPIERPKSQRVS